MTSRETNKPVKSLDKLPELFSEGAAALSEKPDAPPPPQAERLEMLQKTRELFATQARLAAALEIGESTLSKMMTKTSDVPTYVYYRAYEVYKRRLAEVVEAEKKAKAKAKATPEPSKTSPTGSWSSAEVVMLLRVTAEEEKWLRPLLDRLGIKNASV